MDVWKTRANRFIEGLRPSDEPPTPPSDRSTAHGLCSICNRDPICGGMGVISYDVPVGHQYFGKLFRCPNNPVERDAERFERLRRVSNLDALADKTFNTFNPQHPALSENAELSLQYAFKTCFQFAQDLEGWLLLQGTYGCGKTHLAAAIGHEALRTGHNVLFITVPDLLDHLRNSFTPSADANYDETFERIKSSQLLILDDLGAENPSSWALEKLFQLLNYRYTNRLPTVVTTNIDLARIDPRIRSRLMDEDIIRRMVITAPDFRSASASENRDNFGSIARYRHMTFKSFALPPQTMREEYRILEHAWRTASAYAANPQGWLVLHGSYAVGKTHLAAAIANHNVQQGVPVVFVTVLDLMDHLRQTFNPKAPVSFDERFHMIREAKLLVLDDLSTANASSWAKEKLFQIIDYRYINQLPTVITFSDPINQVDQRMMSRISDQRLSIFITISTPPYTAPR